VRDTQPRTQVDHPARPRRRVRHHDRIHTRVGLAVPLCDRLVDHGHHVRPPYVTAFDATLQAPAQPRGPHRLRFQLVRVIREDRACAPR